MQDHVNFQKRKHKIASKIKINPFVWQQKQLTIVFPSLVALRGLCFLQCAMTFPFTFQRQLFCLLACLLGLLVFVVVTVVVLAVAVSSK